MPRASDIRWYLTFSWLTLLVIISRSLHVHANGLLAFFFNGWIVFHRVQVPPLLYLFMILVFNQITVFSFYANISSTLESPRELTHQGYLWWFSGVCWDKVRWWGRREGMGRGGWDPMWGGLMGSGGKIGAANCRLAQAVDGTRWLMGLLEALHCTSYSSFSAHRWLK